MSKQPSNDDIATAIILSIMSGPFAGMFGFGVGAVTCESWLQSFGVAAISAIVTPFVVYIGIGLLKPWRW